MQCGRYPKGYARSLPKRRENARGRVTSCIQDTSRAVSNAVCSFRCSRKPFGILPQGMRLRHPCRRLGKLDGASELHHGKETAASCIMMQSMTIPLAVRLVNLAFPGRFPGKAGGYGRLKEYGSCYRCRKYKHGAGSL